MTVLPFFPVCSQVSGQFTLISSSSSSFSFIFPCNSFSLGEARQGKASFQAPPLCYPRGASPSSWSSFYTSRVREGGRERGVGSERSAVSFHADERQRELRKERKARQRSIPVAAEEFVDRLSLFLIHPLPQ